MSLNIGDLVASVQIDLGDAGTQLDGLVEQFTQASQEIQSTLATLSQTIDNIGTSQNTDNPFAGMAQDAETTGNAISTSLDTSVSQVSDTIQQQVSQASQDASQSLTQIGTSGDEAFTSIQDAVEQASQTVQTSMNDMSTSGQQDLTSLSTAGDATGSVFDTMGQTMSEAQQMVGTAGIAASGGLFAAMETGNQLANTYEKLEGLTGETADQTASLISGFAGAGLSADQAQMMIMRLQMRIGGLGTAYDAQKAKIQDNITMIQQAMQQQGLTAAQYTSLQAKLQSYEDQLAQLPSTFNSAANASNVLAQIGVNWQDAAGKALPLTELMPQIIDGMQQMEKTDPAQAAMIGMRLFGRQFTQMIPMIQAGGDAYTQAANSARQTGDVLTQAQVENAHKLEVAKANLENTFKTAAADISASFTPVVTSIVTTVSKIISAFNNLSPSTKKMIEDILKTVAVFGTALGGATAMGSIFEHLGGVMGPLGGIFAKLGGGLEMFLGPIGLAAAALGALHMAGVNIQPVFAVVGTVIKGVTGVLGTLFTWLNKIGVLVPIIVAVTGAFVAWKTAMAIQGLLSGASVALQLFQAGLGGLEVSEEAASTASYGLGAALDVALGPVGLIVAAIAAAIAIGVLLATHWQQVEQIAKAVWSAIANAVGGFFRGVAQFLSPFIQAISDVFGAVVGVVKDAIGVIVDIFSVGWRVVSTVVGIYIKIITTVIQIIVHVVQGVMAVLIPIVRIAWTVISTVIGVYIKIITTVIGVIVNAVKLPLDLIIALFQAAWSIITTIIGVAIGVIKAVIAPIADVIGVVIGVVVNIFKVGFEIVSTYIKVWFTVVSAIFHTIVTVISTVVGAVVNAFKTGISVIGTVIRGIIDVVSAIVGPVINLFSSMAGGISNVFQGVAGVIGNVIGGIIGVAKGIINGIISAIDFVIGVIDSIQVHIHFGPVNMDWDGLKIPKIPHLAEGGIVPATPGGVLALLGEGGKAEMVTPLDDDGRPWHRGPGSKKGDGDVTINQTFNTANMDPFQVGREVGWTMKTRLR